MTIGGSLTLIAIGAILKWAVTTTVSGFDIQTAGLVLFLVGLFTLPLALAWTFWWADRGETVPDESEYAPPAPPRYYGR